MRSNIPVLASLLCMLLAASITAADPQDHVIGVTASVQGGPLRVALSWPAVRAQSGAFTLYRKSLGAGAWGPGVSLAGNATSYVDTGISDGAVYEYRLNTKQNTVEADGLIAVAVNRPIQDGRGRIILLVDASLAAGLSSSLETLVDDLVGEGWTVLRHDVARSATAGPAMTVSATEVAAVKAIVDADYNADPANTKAVLIIGHVPVPYTGRIAPDGHTAMPYPADMYYGMPGIAWTDLYENAPSTQAAYSNVPGDGKFDTSYFDPAAQKIPVGRIDFHTLPMFARAEFPRDEVQLLRDYLAKDHRWRTKAFTVADRCFIDDNMLEFDGEAPALSAWRTLSLLGPNSVVASDLFSDPTPSMWSHANGGSTSQGLGPWTNWAATGRAGKGAVFTTVFGSGSAYHDTSDAWMRASLASTSICLASVWTCRPHYTFHRMSAGETIGSAFFANLTQPNEYGGGNPWGVPTSVHRALLGDPSLRQHILAPPRDVVFDATGALRWQPSADAATAGFQGYHVYRGTAITGPFTRLTSLPIATTSWTDSGPVAGAIYRVRSVRQQTTTGGVFVNSSTGIRAVPAQPLVITSQPQSSGNWVNETCTFTVGATGAPAPAFQWQRGGVDIPGATAATYVTPTLTMGDNGAVLRCRVSNSAGTVLHSDAATLTVRTPAAGVVTRIRFTPRSDVAYGGGLVAGGQFIGYSGDPATTPGYILATIPGSLQYTGQTTLVLPLTASIAFKNLVFLKPGKDTSMAEVEFWSGQTKLTGTVIGMPPKTPGNDASKMFDGNIATFYDGAGGGYAGLDIGIPAPVPPAAGSGGGITRERFDNVSGTTVASLTTAAVYPNSPSYRGVEPLFESPDAATTQNCGTRMHGYFIAPLSGPYIFNVTSNGYSQLWLSTDADPAHAVKIVSVESFTTAARVWNKSPLQTSAPIQLVAGNRYYISALQKQAGGLGTGNLAVGAILPNGTFEMPIAGHRLDPYAVGVAPTVAVAATAAQSTVTGKTTSLSVLGADDGGEAALTYTWATTGTSPASVSFSVNGTNAAKSTVATFAKAGSYALQVVIRDAGGRTATSAVALTVVQTLTSIAVVPATASVSIGTQRQFAASCLDQFGAALQSQPACAWSVLPGGSGGTVTSGGLYSAPASGAGTATVQAASGAVSGRCTITITDAPPTVALAASATPSTAADGTVALSVLGADDGGERSLVYTWATVGTPPAPVVFSANGVNAAKTTTATCTASGSYAFQVTIRDAAGQSVTSAVSATVNLAPAPLAVQINFQPSSAVPYPGYLIDGGAVFADRGNGQTYGWSSDRSGLARDRNAGNSPDQRYDTLIHFGGTWEAALPNGTYQVHLVCGDPSYYNSNYRVMAEKTMLVDFQPTATALWGEGTALITVTDGRLTLTAAAGSGNIKLCYIEIIAMPAGPG